MNIQNYISKILWVIIYITVAVSVYFYINKSPCDTPITYSVGKIDEKFGITRSDVEKYVTDASLLWNKTMNKTLLQEADNGKIVINFIFDERQRATIQRQKIKSEISEQKQNLDQLKIIINQLKSEYEVKLKDYNLQKNTYEQNLTTYNTNVDYWNNRGGAPKNEYNKLNSQKANIENAYNKLNILSNEIQSLATKINTYSDTHNDLAGQMNNVIDEANAGAGREFEEGVYDPNKKTITIYEYESIIGLKRVLTHELGHVLGIDHVSNKKSIMYYLNNSNNLELTTEDISALQKICKY